MEWMTRRVKMTLPTWLAAAVLLAGGPWAVRAGAQDADAPEPPPPPRVSVGEITGTPGASLMIPLYYTPDPANPLKSLTVNINYVSNNLKYQKLSPGLAAERVGADVAGTLTDGQRNEDNITRSTLRIDASVMGSDPLPEGLLAYLLFTISLEARPFAIRLNTEVASAQTMTGEPAQVNDQDGVVTVELLDAVPEATCFFFTH